MDCLGGIDVFHKLNIPSYGSFKTIARANQDSITSPSIGFNTEKIILVGKNRVFNRYFGPGHTSDNIVSYIPSDRVLFGGCLIKSLGSGEGNLKDADVTKWSETVMKVIQHFDHIELVVPGHGETGNTELLDYTIKMFWSY